MSTQRGMGRGDLPPTPAAPGKNYLLAIGIDRYSVWQPLNNAVRDARDVVDVLCNQYQFGREEVFALFDEQATEANIYQALRDMKRRLNPHDNLVVYYSGHGHYDDEFDEGYWVPVDARERDEGSFISNANIVKRINALDTQHTLMIIDSCFSGSLVVPKRNTVPDERFKSRRVLASGRHETVSDGVKGENSPFTAGLLTYLRKNTSPKLETTLLMKYVKDFVHTKAKQHPVDGRIQNSKDEGGEFVFHLQRDEATVWQEVSTSNTVAAYRNYLAGFPEGQYVAAANRKINELQEDEIWKTAQLNDSESEYEDYITRFAPNGKYLAQARLRLEELQSERQGRQRIQEEMAGKQEERRRLQNEYAAKVKEAEQLFEDRQLEGARDAYRAALRQHLPGFIPSQDYLEEQISLCQTNLTFLEHYKHGKEAMDSGNPRLAIEYFQEALTVRPNNTVEKLIAQCQAQMQSGRKRQTTSTNKRTVTSAPKRKAPIFLYILAGIGGFLVLVMIIGLLVPEEDVVDIPSQQLTKTYPDQPEEFVSDVFEEEEEPVAPTPPPPTPTLFDYLTTGIWTLRSIEVLRNGQAFDATLEDPSFSAMLGWRYQFFPNGSVQITAQNGYQEMILYTMEGTQIYLNSPGYSVGQINNVDREDLQLTLPFTNTFGTHYLRFSLTR